MKVQKGWVISTQRAMFHFLARFVYVTILKTDARGEATLKTDASLLVRRKQTAPLETDASLLVKESTHILLCTNDSATN
jgi:hypothetical protein